MARKVFISVLGTGFYEETQYGNGSFVSTKTRFMQQASLEHFGAEKWTENDRIFILLTEKATTDNWQVQGDVRKNRSDREQSYVGLEKVLLGMNLKAFVEGVSIPQGGESKDMWQVFDTVYGLIEEGDELYFDLTHAFRYLPMLVLVLANYAHFLKNTTIKGMDYGNYEARNGGISLLVDLMPLAAVQDWTHAAANFVENGDAGQMNILASAEVKKRKAVIFKSGGKPNEETKELDNLKNFTNNLAEFTAQMKMCRGKDIYQGGCIGKIKGYKADDTYIQPLNPLFEKIAVSLDSFQAQSSADNLFAAARWCKDHEQYQASVTLLQEGIVTWFCCRHHINIDNVNEREIVNKAIKKRSALVKYRSGDDKDFERRVDEVAADPMMTDDVVKNFERLSALRNDLNHSGFRRTPVKVKSLKDSIDKLFGSVKEALLDVEPVPLTTEKPKPLSLLLINLSNHPYDEWSEEQRKAAEAYGRCEDIAFPKVDPMASAEDIDRLAEDYLAKIEERTVAHHVTVHLMGEMCLVVALVQKLKSRGIACVASTTNRIVEQLPDGTKKVTFDFQQFRPYL